MYTTDVDWMRCYDDAGVNPHKNIDPFMRTRDQIFCNDFLSVINARLLFLAAIHTPGVTMSEIYVRFRTEARPRLEWRFFSYRSRMTYKMVWKKLRNVIFAADVKDYSEILKTFQDELYEFILVDIGKRTV